MNNINFSEIHDCKKCNGKLVMISVDLVGVERCGYCNQVVNYKGFMKKKMDDEYIKKALKSEYALFD